jgi:Helix-turn-helix domain
MAGVGEEHRTYHWGDQPANQRLTVAQAAEVLGITEGAVRSRIKRGTLPTTKQGGSVFVLLGGSAPQANQPPNTGVPTDQSELLEALRDQIRDLREQLGQANERDRENRRIIAALTARIPAIEAPVEPRESPSEATEQPGRVGPQPAVESTRGEDSSPLEAQESHEMHMPEAHGGPRDEPSERPWWRRMFGG